MGKISTYPVDSSITESDFVIGSDAENLNATKNYRVGDILALVPAFTFDKVLSAASYATQLPTTAGVELQVKFGAAQGSSIDPVEIDSNGLIFFNEAGQYLVKYFQFANRTVVTPGRSSLYTRYLINYIGGNESFGFDFGTSDMGISYEEDLIIDIASPGDKLVFQIMRDALGVNEGGLYSVAPGGSGLEWGEIPSASVNIWKIS
jgi:hypothetical protein